VESDFESHAVRKLLERLDVSYISHGLPLRRALAQKRLRDAGGSGRVPFLKDRRTGLKLEGREAIIAYLEREFGGGAGPLSGTGSDSDRIAALAEALNRRREEIKWRLMGPVDEAKLLALDWKRAIRTTLESARELGSAFRGIYRDLAQDLGRNSPRGQSLKLAHGSK
jgi:glutathione S-transferase